jgi:hypothetical protein
MLSRILRIQLMVMAMAALAACSSSDGGPGSAGTAPLRPGVEDSSLVYKGTPSANENAFWVAVRNADDVGRATAVNGLTADIAADPSNGYSQFLVAASYFMPPNAALRALADGSPPPAHSIGTVPYLREALTNLTDPFYLGFDGGLLASLELAAGNVAEGGPRFATAMSNNHAATAMISVLGDLRAKDAPRALDDIYGLLEYCNGGSVDRNGGDAAGYVAKANVGALAQRECYSGYHAPHGTSGWLLIVADLHALNGNATAARMYYDALPSVTDYATWPLEPLAEQRRGGGQAPDLATVRAIAETCATCHTSTLP